MKNRNILMRMRNDSLGTRHITKDSEVVYVHCFYIFVENKMLFNNCAKSMINLCKVNSSQCVRRLSLSAAARIKEITEVKEGKTLKISAEVKPQEDKYLMKNNKSGACPLCAYGLDVKHTDVLIINQFVDSKGELMPRKVTGLCYTQHKRMDYLVEMAKAAGLLSKLYRKEPVQKTDKWKDYNTYFDEETIKYRYF